MGKKSGVRINTKLASSVSVLLPIFFFQVIKLPSGQTIKVFEVFFQDQEKHASLRCGDGLLEGSAVIREPREDGIPLVIEILVVDVLGNSCLQVVTGFGGRRRFQSLKKDQISTFYMVVSNLFNCFSV